jgi:two-component system cell cycle response regulator
MPESRTTGENLPGVLIVDPSKVVLVAARKLLEPHFSVYMAEGGNAAWELIESIPDITAMFTEQNLPSLSGIDLLRRIRESADPRIANLPVVITTSGERDEATRRAALDAGATDFILKPFDAVDLLTRARAWSSTAVRAHSLHEHNQVLRELVMVDTDTRAGNRDYFLQESVKDRSFCIRHRRAQAVLHIAVDHFDRILREQGRVAAREAVGMVAEVIRSKCRREDTFARIGESAFALSLLHTDHIGARVLAERIRQAIAQKVFKARGMAVAISVSIGIYVPPYEADLKAEQLLEMAEKSAKIAARAGGNQTNVVNEGAPRPAAAAPSVAKPAPSGTITLQAESIAEDPQLFIDKLFPLLQRLEDSDRLALIDRLLVMAETPPAD